MSKAATTRHLILQKAFELTYTGGYRATSVDTIIAATRVTKGAFFYHFKTKDEMGVAIVREILKPALTGSFAAALEGGEDPLDAIYKLVRGLLLHNDFLSVANGCPAANLTQEMTPWNAAFQQALDELTGALTDQMARAMNGGRRAGQVRADVSAKQATLFIVSGYWGIRAFGKLTGGAAAYRTYLKELKRYLQSLR